MLNSPSLKMREGRFDAVARLPAVDFLYLVYLFSVVLMSTLGLSAGDMIYVAATAAGAVFVGVRFFSMSYSPRYILLSLALVAFGLLEYGVSRRFTILLTVLLLVGARGIDVRSLLRAFLLAKFVGVSLMAMLVVLGVWDVEVVQYYKMSVGDYISRMRINGSSATILHLSYLSILVLWFYLKKGGVTVGYYILGIVFNFIFYFMSGSTMGFVVGFGSLALFAVCQCAQRFRRGFVHFAPYVLPILLLFSFGTAWAYGSGPLVETLDSLLQGRIYYNHLFLTSYSVSLFGHGMLAEVGNFDNSFVFVFVAYGLIAFVALYMSIESAIRKMSARGEWTALLVMVVYLFIAISESFYPSAAVNPSLFFLVPLYFNDYHDGEE